jgi:hypothetical protein
MIKITGTALVAAALLSAGSAFAGDKAGCCAKGASNKEKRACADFASMNLTADQKSKLESWQADCMKAGCTKESKTKFLEQAKGILSAEQYARVKAACDKPAKKTEA